MPYIGNPAVVGDSTNTFKLLDDIQSFTVTFDATDTAVVSISGDTLTFRNHRFLTGQRVTYTDGGGTAIGGLTDGTAYFIIKVDQNTIQLATNASNAAAGTAIDLTSGAAGGSHTLNVAFDGVNTKFSATHSSGTKASISRAAQISLSINGVIQQPQDTGSPTTGYGVLPGSIIIFSTPPASVDKVFGTFIGEVAPSFDLTDNTVDNFTGDGSTTTFNLSRDVPSSNDILVTLDGVTQYPTDSSTVRSYSVIESTLTFVSAPDTGVAIQVRHIGFAGATTSAVTGFYGRQGNVALTGTDDVSVQNISGVGATFTSNVNIEGVLTYEDVTNVDSIGIITARAGVLVGSGITLSKDGDGFFTGIVTATSYYGDGSNLSNITSTTINNNADNRLITGSGTANTLNGESTLTYDGTNLDLGDDKKIRVGASQDLEIYHSGTYNRSYIQATGTNHDLSIAADEIALTNSAISEVLAKFIANGAVELYYDNSKKLHTQTNGVTVTGYIQMDGTEASAAAGNIYIEDNGKTVYGNGSDLQIYHDGGNNRILSGNAGTNDLKITNTGNFIVETSDSENLLRGIKNGQVDLYYNGTKTFETTSAGVEITGKLTFANDGLANGSIDLGADADLNLYHDNSDAYFDNNTGDFYIRNDGASTSEKVRIQAKGGEQSIICSPNGAVELYHDNGKRLETFDLGIDIGLNATGNYGIRWGGTSYNYANIWTEYGSGDIFIAGGLKQKGTNSGFFSSYGASLSRNAIQVDAFGDEGIHFYASAAQNVTKDDAITVPERVRINQHGLTFNGDSAAANALDDYEEGTFAPMTSTLAEVYHARYTKIGNLVTINTCFEMKSGQARNYIELPFLPSNDGAGNNIGSNSQTNNRYAGTVSFFDSGVNAVNIMLFHQGNQGSSAYFLAQSSSGTQTWPRDINDDFGKVGVSFTYQTAA